MSNQLYEIRIKGQLKSDWAEWLEGMQMRCLDNGDMILSGPLADQAALIGILNKLYRLNLAILSVNRDRTESSESDNRCQKSLIESIFEGR